MSCLARRRSALKCSPFSTQNSDEKVVAHAMAIALYRWPSLATFGDTVEDTDMAAVEDVNGLIGNDGVGRCLTTLINKQIWKFLPLSSPLPKIP